LLAELWVERPLFFRGKAGLECAALIIYQGSEAVADEAQVKILKAKGVKAWNEWRKANPRVRPDLSRAQLESIQLRWRRADEPGVNLSSADLRIANLGGANLGWANLRGAQLNGAVLSNVDLSGADAREAILSKTDMSGASLRFANFREANLSGADLHDAEIHGGNFRDTDFSNCTMFQTLFRNVNLAQSRGLETVEHKGPSTVGIDTIYRSGGKIPEFFLRGAGVPEPFIVHMKSLVAAMSPIEFYSCFISYSSKDQEFAERLHADLRSKNVRCWFAPEDLKIGDRLRPSFDEAIRIHDKLMVLLSKNSVSSPWVEKEVETAFEKERREKRTVLFPIRLDDAVLETNEAWAADIRRGRHIGDFRDWKNHDSYKKAFERLLRDLKADG
jgi:uncharacterized protein YjbI with pentapeptide repeats